MTNKADGFETVEIARKDAPDVRFTGRLLGRVDSDTDGDARGDRPQGKRERWTRLELWELKSGAWVAASIGCSDRKGEVDFGSVEVIEPGGEIRREASSAIEAASISLANSDGSTREERVMAFFGWTWLAKKLAAQLGWDVSEVIE